MYNDILLDKLHPIPPPPVINISIRAFRYALPKLINYDFPEKKHNIYELVRVT